MKQEEVEPNYKSLQMRIQEGKNKMGSVSSKESNSKPLKMEQSPVSGGSIAGRGLSAIDDREIGMALRKLDREQIEAADAAAALAAGSKSKRKAKAPTKRQDTGDENQDGEDKGEDEEPTATTTEVATKPVRNCSCSMS